MKTITRCTLYLICALAMSSTPAALGGAKPLSAAPAELSAEVSVCATCIDFGDNHVMTQECGIPDPDCFECRDDVVNGEENPCHRDFDQPGACGDHHFPCIMSRMTAEENTLLLAAVAKGDAGTIKRLVDAYPATLRVNEKRSLLQWYNCSGEVFGQVALSEIVAANL